MLDKEIQAGVSSLVLAGGELVFTGEQSYLI